MHIKTLKEFDTLYKETADRHGFVPHEGIREEFTAFSKRNQAMLYMGKYKGKTYASAIILYYGTQAIYHHGASVNAPVPISASVQWHALSDAKKKGMWPAYLATFVGSLITAYVLNTFLSFAGAATPEAAALVGAWAWLGFVATTSLGGVLWKGESTNLYLLNGAHGLINFALMAVVLVLVV